MRSANMSKTRLLRCQIATILVLLYEIVVAEHDIEGIFRPEAEFTLFLRMRTKKSPKHSENVF